MNKNSITILLLIAGLLYNMQGNGNLTVFTAETGEQKYKQSIGVSGGITSSGIASGGKLYFSAGENEAPCFFAPSIM